MSSERESTPVVDCPGCDLKPEPAVNRRAPWECGACGRLFEVTWSEGGVHWWIEVRGPNPR